MLSEVEDEDELLDDEPPPPPEKPPPPPPPQALMKSAANTVTARAGNLDLNMVFSPLRTSSVTAEAVRDLFSGAPGQAVSGRSPGRFIFNYNGLRGLTTH